MKKIMFTMLSIIITSQIVFAEQEKNIEKYIETTTYYNKYNDILITQEKEISKREMENNLNQKSDTTDCYGPDYGYDVCRETNYKRVNLGIGKEGNTYIVEVFLQWYTVPLITKFDDIAFRWTNNVTPTHIEGMQSATKNGNFVYTTYLRNGTNTKEFSNAVGITMNMYDNATGHTMDLQAYFSSNPGTIYATYQHARNSSITKSNAMSYTISSSGLGGVLYFSDPIIRNYFDGMQGLTYTY